MYDTLSLLVDVPHPQGEGIIPLHIVTRKHSSGEELERNVGVNIKRDVDRFLDNPMMLAARNEPLAIVAGGPSLDRYIDKIKTFDRIMVCGSAHDYLVSKGVIPHFAVACDAMQDSVDYYQNPQKETTYLLASQCHPDMFDNLKGHKIAMWHFKGQLDDEEKHFGKEQAISWGCMTTVTAIQLSLILGFQELHFFGLDCSYIEDDHHAYDVGRYHADIDKQKQEFDLNGRKFLSTTALVAQAENIFVVFGSHDGRYLKGYVYGDGLLANIIRASPPEMKEWLEAM